MANVNFYYQQYARHFMTISMDEGGLFCQVPSESNGLSYKVYCDESGVCPVVLSCSCLGFRYYHTCKHKEIVQDYWLKMYKTNILKAERKAVSQALDAVDALEAQYEEIEALEEIDRTQVIVAAPVVPTAPKAPLVRKQGDKLVAFNGHFKKPRRFVLDRLEKEQNKASILAEMREIRERRERAPINGNRAFSLMR